MDSSVAEPVAHAAYRQQILRICRVDLELLAQMTDMDVDRPRLPVVGRAPERLEQHLAAVNAPGMRGERAQQLELHVGQLHERPAHLDSALREVDPEPL